MKPALTPGAFIRTYVGEVGRTWVLVYGMPARRIRLDLEDRIVAELANGRRDAEAIGVAAADVCGRPIPRMRVEHIIDRLLHEGVLVPGTELTSVEPSFPNLVGQALTEAEAAAMRLAISPGAKTGCDSRGGCCRLYDRIGLYADDVANVREAFAEDELTPGGLTLESALRLDNFGEGEDMYAVAVRDGACVLLDDDGLCSVHKRLGVMKKPIGCRQYPMRDVYVGGELQVGLAVECRCIIDFCETGESIVPAAEQVLERRRASKVVEVVAKNVGVSRYHRWSRKRYLDWRDAALVSARATDDLMMWSFRSAAELVGGTPGERSQVQWVVEMDRVLAEVEQYFRGQARDSARAYSSTDIERTMFEWAEASVARLRSEAAQGRAPGPALPGEHFFVEQLVFTHNLLRSQTLGGAMCALAIKLATARVGVGLPLPSQLSPLSAVEVLFRAHGGGFLIDSESYEMERALGTDPQGAT